MTGITGVTGGQPAQPGAAAPGAADGGAEAATFEALLQQAAMNFTQIGDAAGAGMGGLLSKSMDANKWSGPDGDPAAAAFETGEEDI